MAKAKPPVQKIDTTTAYEGSHLQPEPTPFLQMAHQLINGSRQEEYGNTLTNFSQTAMLWQGVLAHKLLPTSAVTPEDVALCMMQVKIARLAKSPDHFDSILGVAGYAGCYEQLQEQRRKGVFVPGAIDDTRSHED